MTLENRYQEAINKIGIHNLLSLPEDVKEVLRKTNDLETKVKMLEAVAEQGSGYKSDKMSIKSWSDMEECKQSLLDAFPGSFINEKKEFIAHPRTNQYICLADCREPLDIECKVLEWLSRPAHKTAPYSQEWRNRKFHEFMRNGINDFLDTGFNEQDMSDIYDALGNSINHDKTIAFVRSGYDFSILK